MIYLDNAATSFPKPENVTKKITEILSMGIGTPGRGNHISAAKATLGVNEVRGKFRDFFNLLEDFRIIFTYSATDALNMAVKGFLNKGDHVVITHTEHNSVSRPLKAMERDGFISLNIAPCDEEGYVKVDEFRNLITDKTKLVVVNHGSNVTGAVQPVEVLGQIVREKGSYLLLDAAQTAGVVPIDMRNMPIDMLAAAGHKSLYGLQGTGILVLGERIFKLRPFREGGTGFDSQSECQPVNWPEAYESGTHNVPGIISMGEGLNFINETGIKNIAERELSHITRLYEYLSKFKNITLYGPAPDKPRTAVLSFNIAGWDAEDVGVILNQNYDIHTRAGLQCSPLTHQFLDTFPVGTIRLSPGYFTTEKDIDNFCNAIRRLAQVDVPVY